jgi:hypothetical protein
MMKKYNFLAYGHKIPGSSLDSRSGSPKSLETELRNMDSKQRLMAKLSPGRIFSEILRNRLSLNWGLPEVLSMAPFDHILTVGSDLGSSCCHFYNTVRVSLVKTNE